MPNADSVVTIFETPDELNDAALQLSMSILQQASSGARIHFVLAGGSTPKRLYELLAEQKTIPWKHIHIWFGDERTVGPDHDDSNYKMAFDSLLRNISIPEENIHRMRGEDDPPEAAAAYRDEIAAAVPFNTSGMPVFDLVILGLGEDGHCASLFPDTSALDEESLSVVENVVPQQDTVRITLTNSVLNAAKDVLFLAAGDSKAEAVEAVFTGGDDAPPAARVRPAPGRLHWFIDRAAASKLPGD